MNQAHADMDDCGEWAESHPITQRIHRAPPLTCCNQNCDQGRKCDCQPQPAEACTEVGADQPLTRKESATFWGIASAPAIVLLGVFGFYIWARFGHVW